MRAAFSQRERRPRFATIQRLSMPTSAKGMKMLEVRDLDAGYGRVRVLQHVSLSVPAGKIVALLGANGAGKTTLMRAIAGLISIHGGSIVFAGKTVTGWPPEALVREGLVLVPQGRLLFGDMNVRENLEMGAFSLGKRRHW